MMDAQSYESRGLPLVYHEWGNPKGPPLILLHGFLDQGRSFRFLGPELTEHYRLIAPDHRGHGRSAHMGPGATYYFPDYLLDLEALFVHLGLERAFLAGHSMGASIALYMAGSFPERVRSLLLLDGIGPQAGDAGKSAKQLRDWVRAVRRQEQASSGGFATLGEIADRIARMSPRAPRGVLELIAQDAAVLGDDGRYRFRHDSLHRTPGARHFDVMRFEAFLRAVECPTLLVWGEHTPFKPPDTGHRVSLLSDAQEVVVLGAGHNLHHEAPEPLSRAMATFLSEQVSRG
jgi:pimeloyl-ACP methyl ester carboxylesterase